MQKIIVCCDGTWNTVDQRDSGVLVPTNVVRIFNALAEHDSAGNPQLKYYHPGVGTEPGLWDRVAGGATGAGLDRNIMSSYYWLSSQYQTGDHIYLFGFSRGAYTVRSLAGFIALCGLIKGTGPGIWKDIENLFFQGYRRKDPTVRNGFAFHEFPEGKKIQFIGVWDTVGALGIPDDLGFLNLFDASDEHKFHDTKLSPQVAHARHAIAMEEIRASFQPTVWIPNETTDLKQVWFPGVHCDVGGGYRETGLSDGALKWMIDEAASVGLAFKPNMVEQIHPDHRDALHDSCTEIFKLLPSQPRSIPRLDPSEASIHKSVVDRREDPPISDSPYRLTRKLELGAEQEIQIFALLPWNPTGIWLEKGRVYNFTAKGEWLDGSISCGPDGTNDGEFHAGELVQSAASLVGEFETVWKKITKNQQADIKGTKRHDRLEGERVPWFCLVGAIANGGTANADGEPEPHETFKIGSKRSYTPKASGYLYAYANDAWNFYSNNRGSVVLKVSC